MLNLINEQTTIGAQNFSIHFNEDYFPEAEKFMPERFFGDEQKKSKAAMNPFSEGPRGCLGRKYVHHQIFTIMPRTLMLILEKSRNAGNANSGPNVLPVFRRGRR